MTHQTAVSIVQLPSGVPGLDEVLGGGLPEYSFNVIAGAPGTGKTTLAMQVVFANASAGRPALYFTLLGEPTLKLLRYQQQFGFFAAEKVNRCVHFVSLAQQLLTHDASEVLSTIMQEVKDRNASLVVIDSFYQADHGGDMQLQRLLPQLATNLAGWQVTTLLIGEYALQESVADPVLSIADGILTLSLTLEGETSRRRVQIRKMRGQRSLQGLHSMRISDEGVQIFPRAPSQVSPPQRPASMTNHRLSSGVPGLDEMLGGGIPYGDVVLVSGASGTGKSVLATQFLVEGSHHDEPGVAALFDEAPHTFATRARELGNANDQLFHAGRVRPLDLRSLDQTLGEILLEIRQAVAQIDARRVVIDSLAGLRMVTNASSRASFEELVHRLVSPLTSAGLTVLLTAGDHSLVDLVSFLADDQIELRQEHVQNRHQRSVRVTKMRTSRHSSDLGEFEISGAGIRLPHDPLIFGLPASGQHLA